jgi:hypothetical protein
MTAEPDPLSELFHIHTLQRRAFRRFALEMLLALVGCASCLLAHAVVDRGIGGAGATTITLAMLSVVLALREIRDIRSLQARMKSLAGRLCSTPPRVRRPR